MLKHGVVCEQQRDTFCYVAIRRLEKRQDTRVAYGHGMQRYLAYGIAKLLDIFEIGYDGVAVTQVQRNDCTDQDVRLGPRRVLPINPIS